MPDIEELDPTGETEEFGEQFGEEYEEFEDPEVDDAGPKTRGLKSVQDSNVYADPIPLADIFQDRGLALVGKMTFEEWARLGPNLLRMEEGHQFWLGDWYGYGENAWGDDVFQVVDPDRFELKTLENYRWVSAQIPLKERHAGLKWTHHRIAAELPTMSLRRKVLKRAVSEQLTTRQLQEIVAELKPAEEEGGRKKREKTSHSWNLSFSLPIEIDEATGDQIHRNLQEFLEKQFVEFGVSFDTTGVKISPSKS
jgi:hypothetical protein